MAIKYPWLSGKTAEDPESAYDAAETGAGLVGRALQLAPLAAGAYFGVKSLRSNEALSATGLGPSSMRGTDQAVGDKLTRMAQMRQSLSEARVEKMRKRLVEGGALTDMLKKEATERNVVLASLLEALDDPALREAQIDVDSYKTQIRDVLASTEARISAAQEENVSKIISSVIDVAPDSTSRRFLGRNMDLFAGIADQIAPPVLPLKGLSPNFQPIDEGSLSAAAQRRLRGYRAEIKTGASNVAQELVQIREAKNLGGGVSTFLKVGSPRVGGQFTLLPLEMARTQGGAPLARVGRGATTYIGSQIYGHAPSVVDHFNKGGKLTTQFVGGELGRVGGAFFQYEDVALRTWQKEMQRLGGDFRLFRSGAQNTFNQYLLEMVDYLPREAAASSQLGAHLRSNMAVNAAQAKFIDAHLLPQDVAKRFRAQVITSNPDLFDPASDPMTRRMEYPDTRAYVSTGFRGGVGALRSNQGIIDAVRDIGGVGADRVLLPGEARIKQMIGREGRFVSSNSGINTVGSTLGKGTGITEFGMNLGLTQDGFTGGMNRIAVLDVSKQADIRLGLAEGEAYVGRSKAGLLVQEALPKAVLDPASIGGSSTKLLNELIERRRIGASPLTIGSTLTYGKLAGTKIGSIDDIYRLFGSRSQEGGLVLGMLDEQISTVPRFSGIQNISLRIGGTSDAMGRTKYNITGHTVRNAPYNKLFGMLGKVTSTPLTESTLQEVLSRGTGAYGALQKMGVRAEQVMLSEGSMLKKAPMYLANQMISGLSIAGGIDYEATRQAVSNQVRSRLPGNYRDLAAAGADRTKQSAFITAVSEAVMDVGRRNNIGATGMGMVMAGAYNLADKAYGTNIDKIIRGTEGIAGGFADDVIRVAQEGMALGAAEFAPGPQASTLRSTLGSMEPRYYQFMAHNLQNVLGLSADVTADFMGGILARKAGSAEELQTLKQLTRMTESIGGHTRLRDASWYKKLSRVSVDDFITNATSEEMTRDFLRRHEGGFILEFGSGKMGRAAEAAVLGGPGLGGSEMFIAGGDEFLDMIRSQGTEIKSGSGTKEILPEYLRKVQQLSHDLSVIHGTQGASSDSLAAATTQLRSFKTGMAGVFARSFRGLLSGKLRGSLFAQGAAVNLGGMGTDSMAGIGVMKSDKGREILNRYANAAAEDSLTPIGHRIAHSAELSEKQLGMMRKAFGRVQGNAVFAETDTFLAAMRSYIGGVADEKLMSQKGPVDAANMKSARGQAVAQAGRMFDTFFTGQHRTQVEGLTTMLSRYPLLAPTHVGTATLLRYAGDFGEGKGGASVQDLAFERFVGTEEGKAALRGLEEAAGLGKGKITGFAAISNLADTKKISKARKAFFGSMAQNIDKYAMGEGGGRIIFPSMLVDVHYGDNTKRRIDLSLASAMIGDFDADIYQLLFPSEKQAKVLQESQSGRKQLVNQMMYGAETRILMEESKVGIANLAKVMAVEGGLSDLGFMYEGALKERIAKEVGQADVALDHLRLGMVRAAEAGNLTQIQHGQRAMVLTQVLEESILKAKKLPRAAELADRITGAAQRMLQTGGEDTKAMMNVLEQIIFRESDVLGKGIQVSGIDTSGIADKGTRQIIEKELLGRRIELQSAVDEMARGAAYAKEAGLDATRTFRSVAGIAEGGHRGNLHAWLSAISGGGSVQGAMIGGTQEGLAGFGEAFGDMSRRISSASGRMSSKLLGPIALGVAGTIGLGAMMGSGGYSPTPLLSPGEISDSRIDSAIRRGTAMNSQGPSQEQMAAQASSPAMNMIDRPINVSDSYHQRRNAYSISGHLVNSAAAREVTSLLSNIGGKAHVTVNDTRGPITPNYIDRFFD